MTSKIVIRVDSQIRVSKVGLDNEDVNALKLAFTFDNPDYTMKRLMKIPGWWNEPKDVGTWFETDEEMLFPRGCLRKVRDVLDDCSKPYRLIDKRTEGSPCLKFPEYIGLPLRYYQENGIDEAIKKQNCVIRLPTGSGKSIMAIALSQRIGLNTLVILPTVGLFDQWCQDARENLNLGKDGLGIIHQKKRTLRPITAAVQGTLAANGIDEELKDFFGVVIVDECFTGETPVLMEDGTLKPIATIGVGEKVAAGGRVLRTMRRDYEGPLYKVGTATSTADHPIATSRGWIKASEVCSSDVMWYDPMHEARPLVCPVWTENAYRSGASRSEGSSGDRREQSYGSSTSIGREEDILPRVEGILGVPLPGAVRFTAGCAEVSQSRAVSSGIEVFNLETEKNVYVAGGVLVHNCQKAAARTYVQVVDPFPAKYRIGISADERRKDKKDYLTNGLFGSVAYEKKRKELEDEGFIVDVEIRVVPTEFEADWYGLSKNKDDEKTIDFKRLLDEMTSDEARTNLALKFAFQEVEEGQQVILLSHRVEHCQRLERAFVSKGVRSGFFLGGAEHRNEFEATRAGIKDGSVRAGVGTYSALGIGVNLPAVGAGVATTPIGGNKFNFNQVRGRLNRKSKDKKKACMYWLWDRHVYPSHLKNVVAWNPTVKIFDKGRWIDARHYLKANRR